MLKSFKILLAFSLWHIPVANAQVPQAEIREPVSLQECQDEQLGVRFLCHPDWEIQTQNNVLLIIISADPAVTMTVAKSASPVAIIDQLERDDLLVMGQYDDQFTYRQTLVDHLPALKVEALSAEFPEIKLMDFYIVNNIHLYSILFSVDPLEEWGNYAPLFEEIIESFKFIPKTSADLNSNSIESE